MDSHHSKVLVCLLHADDPFNERRQRGLATTCPLWKSWSWKSLGYMGGGGNDRNWNAKGSVLLERMEGLEIAVLYPHVNVSIQKPATKLKCLAHFTKCVSSEFGN